MKETNLCEENKMLLNSEVIKENVVLRAKTKTTADFVNVMPNVKPVNNCCTTGRW